MLLYFSFPNHLSCSVTYISPNIGAYIIIFGGFFFPESDVEPCELHNEEGKADKIVCVIVIFVIIFTIE